MWNRTAKIILLFMLTCAALLFFCLLRINNILTEDEEGISLVIHLDLKEDIGLLIIDYDIDGKTGSGGMSNADRTKLSHDETLYWTFNSMNPEGTEGPADITLDFSVITEYCDPNYDNVYPEEYRITVDPVRFTAQIGETYSVEITGDRTNGYRAELEKED